MAPFDLNDVALFVRVVERAGFAKVARDLGVPTSTVSRAISRLEDALGSRLIARSTRSVRPTADGHAFYADVAPAIAALHHAARGVDGADRALRGRLRITAPNDIGSTFLAEVVVEFAQRCPNVSVETVLTNRHVSLVEDGFDIALRASRTLPDSSLIARKVGQLEADLYASIDYIKARGMPATPLDLARHDLVLFRAPEGKSTWPLVGPTGDEPTIVHGRVAGDDYTFVRAAVLAGGGIALIPRIVAAPDVVAGRLVRVLPQHGMRGVALHLVHAGARVIPAKIAAFRDFVMEAFARKQAPTKLEDERPRTRDKKPSRPLRSA
jgi:DNA-binding transcriptional LysR family regulator